MDQRGKAFEAFLPEPGRELLRVHLCGGALRLTTADGVEIQIKSAKGRALLARLCLAPDGRTSRSATGFMLWGDSKSKVTGKAGKPAATPVEPFRINLREELARLRADLGEHRDVITADRDEIRIDLTQVWTDTRAVLEQIVSGETLAPGIEQRPLLSEFRSVSDEFDDWLDKQRRKFSQHKQAALTQRAARIAANGLTLRQKIAEYNKLFDFDETDEEICRLLMLALMENGSHSRARQVYHRCRAAVRREIDCEPDTVTRELFASIAVEPTNGTILQDGAAPTPALRAAAAQIHHEVPPSARSKPYVEPILIGLRHVGNLTGDSALDGLARTLFTELQGDLPMLMAPLKVVEVPMCGLHVSDIEQKCRFVIDLRLRGNPDDAENSLRLSAQLATFDFEHGVAFRKFGRSYRTDFDAVIALNDPSMLSSRIANRIFLTIAAEWSEQIASIPAAAKSVSELVLLGLERLARPNTRANLAEARYYFDLALRRDGENVDALVGLAHVYHRLATQPSFTEAPAAALRQGQAYIDRALEIENTHARGKYISGMLSSTAGKPEVAAVKFDEVVRLTHMPTALSYRGYNRVFLGDPLAGRTDIRKSLVGMRDDASLHILHMFDGTAAFHSGDVSGAIEAFETSLHMAPQYGSSRLWLAGTLLIADKPAEARENMQIFRSHNPKFRLTDFDATWGGGAQSQRPTPKPDSPDGRRADGARTAAGLTAFGHFSVLPASRICGVLDRMFERGNQSVAGMGEGGLATVFGGSGFVGRHTVRALARNGWRVRAAVRRPDLAGHLQPMGNVGQIHAVQANLRYPASVAAACAGADVVVNLVAVMTPSGKQNYEALHVAGARAVAKAAREAGVKRLIHISAIGADRSSKSKYARSKAAGEAAVLEEFPDAIILRPSIVFGPEDEFFNRFAAMARISPLLPLIGGGRTRFQPVFVGDLAAAIANTAAGADANGSIYEIGGPDVVSMRQVMEKVSDWSDRRRGFLRLPFWTAKLAGFLSAPLPNAARPITVDQVRLLQKDNVVADAAKSEGRTIAALGISAPHAMGAVVPSYLERYRPRGQYSHYRG